MEVLEAESYLHEEGLNCRTIYRFTVDDNIKDDDGRTEKVVGHFEKVNGISKRLQRILLNNGVEKIRVQNYAACGKEVKP
jgi:ribosomal protein S16